jgi:aquaporin Z
VDDARPAAGFVGDEQVRQEHPAQSGWHFVDWGCEFVGTMVLVLGGVSAVVLDFGTRSPVASIVTSHSLRLLLTGLLFAGCGSLVAISPIGRRSGAHLNPSITVAFFCHRHLRVGDAVGYIVAQCLGAIAGAGAIRLLWGARAASVRDGRTLPGPGVSTPEAVAIEALMTAVLVLVVFAFVSSTRTARWTPLAVWIVVAVLVWRGAPYTGTSLNAARSLGPVVVTWSWSDYWVYLVGPLAGVLVAVGLWVLVPRRTLTAKLFHDAKYPSVLRSWLPVRR